MRRRKSYRHLWKWKYRFFMALQLIVFFGVLGIAALIALWMGPL